MGQGYDVVVHTDVVPLGRPLRLYWPFQSDLIKGTIQYEWHVAGGKLIELPGGGGAYVEWDFTQSSLWHLHCRLTERFTSYSADAHLWPRPVNLAITDEQYLELFLLSAHPFFSPDAQHDT